MDFVRKKRSIFSFGRKISNFQIWTIVTIFKNKLKEDG
jgi:hypothetical protein